jgi:hypothetical protein
MIRANVVCDRMDPSSSGAPPDSSKSVEDVLKQLTRSMKKNPDLIELLQSRPHVQVPTSSTSRLRSDIVDTSTALAVVKVIKRGRTDVPHRTLSRKDPVVFAKDLFNEMKANMKAEHLNTSRMIPMNFQYLLPTESTTREQLTIFEAVRSAPLTVTNVELSRILNLELSTQASPPTQIGYQHYYIRSWTFTFQELAALCTHMAADDSRLSEVAEWLEVGKLHRNNTKFFTIRYAGTVVGPGRPCDRYTEDLAQRTSGILAEFTRAVDTIAPHVAQAAQIFLLRDASVRKDDVVMALSDPEDRERMLIEFLGHSSLLNRQRGGYFTSYVPSHEDVQLFRRLRTDAWHSFKNSRLNCSDEVFASLTSLLDDIQDYANSNADLTGTWRLEFSDALREMTLQQATPYCFSYFSENVTPIVFIGRDITYEAYVNATPFLATRTPGRTDHAGQAGAFVRDIIQRLADDETLANGRDLIPNSFRADRSFWLFFNLWQWLAHKDLEEATRFLQRYLSIVRPLIAVSSGLTTTNVVLANFDSLNGAKLNAYTPIICTPTIQYYDVAGPKKHDPDSAFINVPMFDPGRDKYGSNSLEIRRLIDMSMRYAFLLIDIAGEVLSEPNGPQRNRLELCHEILRRLNSDTRPARARFLSALQSAKDDCASYIRTSFTQTSSEDVRPVLDHAGRQIMRSLGTAEGAPYSFKRDMQLDEIWDRNTPELHSLVPHNESLKEKWKETFVPLQEDQYFYLAVLANLPPDTYLANLLDTLRPEWAKDDSWVHDKSERDRALASVQGGLWVTRKNEVLRKSTVQFPDQPVKAKSLHNHQVGFVDSNDGCTLRWIGLDGTARSTLLRVRSAVSKTDFETRTLLFTEHGINIVSGTGEMFRGRLGHQDLATFPLDQVLNRRELYELWSSVRQAHGHAVPPFGVQFDASLARDWGTTKGVAALTQQATSVPSHMNRPPAPLDALYPLDAYINIHFPSGGNFYYHSPADEVVRDKRRAATAKPKATVTTEDMKRFLEMLDTPEWVAHPYREFWKQELGVRSPPQVGFLSKNLPLLRNTKMKTFPRGARSLFWELGPPESAVDDIFDAANGQSCLSAATKKASSSKAKASKATSSKGKTAQVPNPSTSTAPSITAPNSIMLSANTNRVASETAAAGRPPALQRRTGFYVPSTQTDTFSANTPYVPPGHQPGPLSRGSGFAQLQPPAPRSTFAPYVPPTHQYGRSVPTQLPAWQSTFDPYAPPGYRPGLSSRGDTVQSPNSPLQSTFVPYVPPVAQLSTSSPLRQSLKRSADEAPQTSGSDQPSLSTKKSRRFKKDQEQGK